MARRAHAYPQVDPGAAGLVDVAVLRLPAGATVGEALRRARARDAGVAAVGQAWVLRDDLARAATLGLDDLRAASLARPLPVTDARASEVAVRRLLAAGAPAVVVTERRGVVGAVAARGAPAVEGPSLGERFAARLAAPVRRALAVVREVAAAQRVAAFVAGGTVRDAVAGRAGERRDLDVVVEGDGLLLARALARSLGGDASVIEHARFLTASVTVSGVGRIDVATARAERYEAPGALPRVVPATIGQDLGRRDFTVNALAVELASGAFALIDLHGGRADVARRRIRVLHPLSFVEDPTRMFRAARYAARLGFAPDAWTLRAQALALGLGAYPALSGQRLLAELELVAAEPEAAAILRRLAAAGVFRLLDPRYRFDRRTAARIAALPVASAWSAAHGLRVTPVELALLAALGEQPRDVARAALARLGLAGEPLLRLQRAMETGRQTLQALGAAARPSERARLLRGRSDVELAWLALAGDDAGRGVVAWFVGHARGARPALDGDDVRALGVPAGAGVARVLAALRDARLDGLVEDRDGEVARVRDWLRQGVPIDEPPGRDDPR